MSANNSDTNYLTRPGTEHSLMLLTGHGQAQPNPNTVKQTYQQDKAIVVL